ncbi:MAG: nitroreductase family protein [Rubrivivax sp.]
MNHFPVARRPAGVGTLLGPEIFGDRPVATRASGALRTLPAPQREGGRPLMQALAARRSTREFQPRPLSDQHLSDLLWAADGINRPSGDRTSPYWRHVMVLDIYAALADGLWLYEPTLHALRRQSPEDLRALTGVQDYVAGAPLNLVYVVRGERLHGLSDEQRRLHGSVDAAFAGQNVYLYCASEGLGCVFRGSLDPERLGQAMGLPPAHLVVFAQSVGHRWG